MKSSKLPLYAFYMGLLDSLALLNLTVIARFNISNFKESVDDTK